MKRPIKKRAAEKLSAPKTADYFRERANRANPSLAGKILERAGRGKPPVKGDELWEESSKKSK